MNEWEWRLLEEKSPTEIVVSRARVQKGDRVRLHTRARGDVLDLALDGKTARVASIEEDYDGAFHVSVVLDEDPGNDIGRMRMPGHRFFFSPEEVELLEASLGGQDKKSACSVLIAGIGNIFLGDDGFGVEVAQRLVGQSFPANVQVVDFGIRGIDLAYALMDAPDVTILIDACPRGAEPGTLHVIEINPADCEISESQGAALEAHAMNPLNVLRMAKLLGAPLKRILLVGCEPMSLGDEGGTMALSSVVASAVERAVEVVRETVTRVLDSKSVGDRQPQEGG